MDPSFSCYENLRHAVEGLRPEWIPFTLDIGAISGLTDPILRQFKEATGSEKSDEYFGYDFRTSSVSAHFGGEGYVKNLAIASARAGIDVLCFYDDVGMQISPALWRHFIKPHWNDILSAVRSACPDSIFFLHSCGNISEILPDIVELGFHILHPVQPECMEFVKVREEFGKDILLCATVSAQKIFPFAKPEEMRREIRLLKEICSTDNRCILTPSNMVQPETPWENILAFVEEAQRGRPVRDNSDVY